MTDTRVELRETTGAATPVAGTPGSLLIGLITPGWGSSGYYPAAVLESAASSKVFPAGTHIYFDHPSVSEMSDRPERSVKDLAAVLSEDARWNNGRLEAQARVIGPYRELVTDPTFAEAVGLSIRATADTTVGEAEGRTGTIVSKLVEGLSVDLVTHAGRGGSVLAVLESAKVPHVAIEAMSDNARTSLAAALGTGGYVVDYDPEASVVVYSPSGIDGYMKAPFSVDESGNYTIDTASATPVIRHTQWVSPTATQTQETRSSSGNTTHLKKGNSMGNIQVDEAEHRRLTEDAGRVSVVEGERDTAIADRDSAQAELANYKAREAAYPALSALVNEAADIPASQRTRIIDSVRSSITSETTPEQVREAAERQLKDKRDEIEELRESLGLTRGVVGFGASIQQESGYSADDFRKELGLTELKAGY